VPSRAYTDAELDAAIDAINDPIRLREAQNVVARTAPALQRLLGVALEEGGWFDLGHDQAVREATSSPDPGDRVREVRTLLAEETRLGMLVGVAIGFELANELATPTQEDG
jgi:PAS domain-containing protein